MKIAEFAPIMFAGIDPALYKGPAEVAIKQYTDAMTFRIDGDLVETLNGQARQGLSAVINETPERRKAFIYALILAAETTGRKVVLRVREDGGRIQLGKV